MPTTVECDIHGNARMAFVCQHLFATLKDEDVRGVVYMRDENGCYNAYCSACELKLEDNGGEWNDELEEQADIKLICEHCMERILDLNDAPRLN